MLRGSDGTDNAGLLLIVGEALAGKISRAALGSLDDDGGLDVAGGFENSIGSGGRGHILGKKGQPWDARASGTAHDGLHGSRVDLG